MNKALGLGLIASFIGHIGVGMWIPGNTQHTNTAIAPTEERIQVELVQIEPTHKKTPITPKIATVKDSDFKINTNDENHTIEKDTPVSDINNDNTPLTKEVSNVSSAIESAKVRSKTTASIIRNVAPTYPSLAQRFGYDGKVVLHIQVLENGKTGDIHIIESSGHTMLDNAAKKAIKKWRFEPAKKNNIAVKDWVTQNITFKLEN